MNGNGTPIMHARDSVSAALAECFVTIEGERFNFMQAINLEANFEKKKTEVPILGKPGRGNKSTGWAGTGSATFHYTPKEISGVTTGRCIGVCRIIRPRPIGHRMPRPACGLAYLIRLKNGPSGASRWAHMTHTTPGPKFPTTASIGSAPRTGMCGNLVCMGGRRKPPMEHKTYIARKRARFDAVCGPVNIPYGTPLQVEGDFLCLDGKPLCYPESQTSLDFFSQNDDGNGLQRGKLVGAILSRLEKRDSNHQKRWNKVWADPLCQRYRRAEHEDYWIWNPDFFSAPVLDLRRIAALVGA